MAVDRDRGDGPPKKPTLLELLPKILLITFVVLNIIAMIGAVGVIYFTKIIYKRTTIVEETESVAFAADRDLQDKRPILYSFEPFTVNLDGRPRKILRTTIQVEMLNAEGYEETVDLVPKVRDEIVRIFNGKKFEDLETIQGKLFLKDEIKTAMNKMLHKGTVKELYFGEFVVQ